MDDQANNQEQNNAQQPIVKSRQTIQDKPLARTRSSTCTLYGVEFHTRYQNTTGPDQSIYVDIIPTCLDFKLKKCNLISDLVIRDG